MQVTSKGSLELGDDGVARGGRPARSPWRFSFASLRLRLVALVGFCLLPALAFILHAGARERREAVGGVRESCLQSARMVALEHEELFVSARSLLTVVSELPHVQEGNWTAASRTLAKLTESDARYANLGVIAPDGNVVASAVLFPGTMFLGDRTYFRRAMETGTFAVGDYQVGRISGKPSINVAMPLLDERGDVRVVVFAALDLGWLNRRDVHARLPERSMFTIIDNGGKVLARHPLVVGEDWIGRDVAGHDAVATMLARREGGLEARGLDGKQRIFGFTELPTSTGAPGGVVYIAIERDIALAKARTALAQSLVALLAIALIAVVTALTLGELLVLRRLRRLLRVVRRLAVGDLRARTGTAPGGGELTELERAFDEMATSLAGRDEQLRDAEERYRRLVEEVPAIFYVARDDEGRTFTFVSRQVERLGIPPSDLVGRSGAWSGLLHPDDREGVLQEYLRCRAQRRPFTAQYRLARGDGKWCWLSDTCVFSTPEEPPWCRGFLLDVTAARLSEEQFLQAQKMEAVGRLASGVAHDFNNLLTVVSGYAQVLVAQTSRDDPRLGDLEELQAAAQRGTELTQQLLSFARKQTVEPVLVDVNAVVTGTQRMLRRLIGADVEVNVVLGADLPAIKADPAQLEQALVNLVVNARDAMPQGGTLRLSTSTVEIEEDEARLRAGVRPGRHVVVAVSDTGSGMDPETQAHIFEPFFTTKPPGKGTGLGLPSVYGIVTQHGGHVVAESEPGVGTTFRLYFPAASGVAARDAPPAPRQAGATAPQAGPPAVILLVEDEDRVRRAVSGMLASMGHVVLDARDEEEAIALSERHRGNIDLLLSDFTVTEVSGGRLEASLLHARPSMKVLLMSGHAAGDVVGAGAPGFGRPFIQKPFTPESLDSAVRHALGAGAGVHG